MNTGEILIYQNSEGSIKIDVRLEEETVWLTQDQIAILFGKSKSTINEHIKNIYSEGELVESTSLKKFGISEFQQKAPNYYNLDVIISVGYRVKSQQGTQFRIWATQRLKEYIVKGISLINLVSYSRYISIKYQYITTLLTIICENIFANSKNCHTFDTNNTCHASHSNSAPGQVFAFNGPLVSMDLNTKAHALQ